MTHIKEAREVQSQGGALVDVHHVLLVGNLINDAVKLPLGASLGRQDDPHESLHSKKLEAKI